MTGSTPPKVEANATIDPRSQTLALLDGARRQQAAAAESAAGVGGGGRGATERQRLLDRLTAAYGARLKLLDDLDALQKPHPETLRLRQLIGEFAGPPPYPALRVDLLRDEADSLQEHMRGLTSEARVLEAQKLVLATARQRAAEALRLAEDKLARSSGEPEISEARLDRELAGLQVKLAEANLTNMAIGLDSVSLEARRQQALVDEVAQAIVRVVPGQQLSKDDLDEQKAWLRNALVALNAEVDRRVAGNTRRIAEREDLAKRLSGRGSTPAALWRQKVLDVMIDTDRIVLMTLNWQQTLFQVRSDAWEQRYAGLKTPDPVSRNASISALSQIRTEMDARRSALDELKYAAHVAVRDQELRLGRGQLDGETMALEKEILDSLRQRVDAYEKLELSRIRLGRNVERWLEDLGFDGTPASTDDWRLVAVQAGDSLKKLWAYEIFAVEDSTVVDGKTISVSYGVTVGKSIGALILFLLGYWLLTLLSRRLQGLMVLRFGVGEQLAIVLRRWIMIALVLMLVVFILNLARIPLTVFAFMGGALVIGVGIGTQNIIKNVVSGIIILFERKIRVGDIVSINGQTGHVTAVDLRASTVRGFDGIEALIPNSIFLENQVANWTYSNPHIRREIRVGVSYGAPVKQAAEIVRGCADDHGQVLKNPAPEVFFEDFGESALVLSLVFWVELGPNLVARRVDSDLRYAIEKRLAAAGIGIPFPQRDLHLEVSQPLPVRFADAGEGQPQGAGLPVT